MATVIIDEPKGSSPWAFFTDNVISAAIRDFYSSLSEKRKALGLQNPGTVELIAKEVQRDVLLNNYMFTGLRFDLGKTLSTSPIFEMTQAFSIGQQYAPPWRFDSMFGTSNVRIKIGAPRCTRVI